MNKRWTRNTIAVILVAIGIIALFQNHGMKSKAYTHTLRLDDHMRGISIIGDSHALEVNFVSNTEGSNSIRVEGKAKPEVIDLIETAKVENGELNLRFKEKWHWGLFDFSGWNEKQIITVLLTDEAMKSLESFKVSSDSGSIKLDRYEGNSLSITSDSGSIHAGTVRAALKAASDSGSITVDHLTGASEVKSDSGSIRIVKDDEVGANVSNDSGSVRITVPASYSGSYDLKSDSGSIHNPDPVGTSGELIKVRTDSGSIRIIQQ